MDATMLSAGRARDASAFPPQGRQMLTAPGHSQEGSPGSCRGVWGKALPCVGKEAEVWASPRSPTLELFMVVHKVSH